MTQMFIGRFNLKIIHPFRINRKAAAVVAAARPTLGSVDLLFDLLFSSVYADRCRRPDGRGTTLADPLVLR